MLKDLFKKALSSGVLANLFCLLIIAASLLLFYNGNGSAAVITLGAGIALFGSYMLTGALLGFPYLYRAADPTDKNDPRFRSRRVFLLLFSSFLMIAGVLATVYGIFTA